MNVPSEYRNGDVSLPQDIAEIKQLQEIVRDYAQHDSWRCAHPDRYPQDEDCPCELLSTLAAAGIDPEPWRAVAER